MVHHQGRLGEVLARGVVEILPSRRGLEELMHRRKIRVYLGIDPTAENLHLGHAIPLRKLSEFAALGHEAILLVGTFTGQIGDPSDRLTPRQSLTPDQIKKNMASYQKQASKIIDFSQVAIKYNAFWLAKLTFKEVAELASHFTVQQIIERDFFQERVKQNQAIYLHEFLYPLMQGYDSVAMNVDLEIGATDQKFNMLVGRRLQRMYNRKEKFILTTPMLLGTDGHKMGKTNANTINLTDKPFDMYGKVMSISDDLTLQYFELATQVPLQEIKVVERTLREKSLHPMEAKKRLAREIVSLYYDEKTAKNAEKEFARTVQKGKPPSAIKTALIKQKTINIIDLLLKSGLVASSSQAKKLVEQGGVEINEKKINHTKLELEIKDGDIVRAGKRKFVKIKSR